MQTQLTGNEKPNHSQDFLRKRKFFLIIPLLILPFLTMAFWALGGGKTKSTGKSSVVAKGLDTALPQARFKSEKDKDKMDVYQDAGKDTANSADGISNSFARAMGLEVKPGIHKDSLKTVSGRIVPADAQSAGIEARLAQINRQINRPQPASYVSPSPDPEVKRLNKMMKAMNREGNEDPEMKQLNSMLSKIQAIQHPETVKAAKDQAKETDSAFRAIPAVIDGKQKVKDGGTVRLKLTDSTRLKGMLLPKGQLLFGACSITNQRLLLHIQNIRIGKDILPADLTVFSLDGMPGIPAPEAELAGAAGNGADNAISNMQFLSMDQSISAQAAAGGINAAKGLLSKKVKKIKVRLDDNEAVLLRDNSRKK